MTRGHKVSRNRKTELAVRGWGADSWAAYHRGKMTAVHHRSSCVVSRRRKLAWAEKSAHEMEVHHLVLFLWIEIDEDAAQVLLDLPSQWDLGEDNQHRA